MCSGLWSNRKKLIDSFQQIRFKVMLQLHIAVSSKVNYYKLRNRVPFLFHAELFSIFKWDGGKVISRNDWRVIRNVTYTKFCEKSLAVFIFIFILEWRPFSRWFRIAFNAVTAATTVYIGFIYELGIAISWSHKVTPFKSNLTTKCQMTFGSIFPPNYPRHMYFFKTAKYLQYSAVGTRHILRRLTIQHDGTN